MEKGMAGVQLTYLSSKPDYFQGDVYKEGDWANGEALGEVN